MAAELEKMETQEFEKNLKLMNNVEKCNDWVADKLDAKPDGYEASEYERKDGSAIDTVLVSYNNGDTFQVSESRFWKVKE